MRRALSIRLLPFTALVLLGSTATECHTTAALSTIRYEQVGGCQGAGSTFAGTGAAYIAFRVNSIDNKRSGRIIASKLVHPRDQPGMLGEDAVSRGCGIDQVFGEQPERQPELLPQFVLPLLDQANGVTAITSTARSPGYGFACVV